LIQMLVPVVAPNDPRISSEEQPRCRTRAGCQIVQTNAITRLEIAVLHVGGMEKERPQQNDSA
jgi:hypothetical protein